MKTLADVKRLLKPGLKFRSDNIIRPEASGERTVDKVQGNGFFYRFKDKDGADKRRLVRVAQGEGSPHRAR